MMPEVLTQVGRQGKVDRIPASGAARIPAFLCQDPGERGSGASTLKRKKAACSAGANPREVLPSALRGTHNAHPSQAPPEIPA